MLIENQVDGSAEELIFESKKTARIDDIKEDTNQVKPTKLEDMIDDESFSQSWDILIKSAGVMHNGKLANMNEIMNLVKTKVNIPQNCHDISVIRAKEIEIGNLMSAIMMEKTRAEYAFSLFNDQKQQMVGAHIGRFSASKKPSQIAAEGELASNNDEFKVVRNLFNSARANKEFWSNMYEICAKSIDCLKQISITVTSEMKNLDPSTHGVSFKKV